MFNDDALTLTTDQPGSASGMGTSRRTRPLRGSDAFWVTATAASTRRESRSCLLSTTRCAMVRHTALSPKTVRRKVILMTTTRESCSEVARENSTQRSRATGAPRGDLTRPAELSANLNVSGLVDAEGGLIDRAIFTDQTLYQQELRRVFAPSWLFLAHVDQFHKPGDFFTTYMGEDPVIVTMDKGRNLRAYLNSCRHRGARVCRADFGQTRNFTCTYHAGPTTLRASW